MFYSWLSLPCTCWESEIVTVIVSHLLVSATRFRHGREFRHSVRVCIHAKMPRLCANESASLREALGRRKELPEFAAVGDDILNKLEIVIHVGTLFGRPTALCVCMCDLFLFSLMQKF